MSLGANLPSAAGGPLDTLEAALAAVADAGITVVARSSWWATPAFPAGSGPEFVNGAAVLETELDPAALLDALIGVEARLGRRRLGRWTPRTLDLDLLAWGDRVLPDLDVYGRWLALSQDEQRRAAPDALILPHPRLQERVFVLAPMAEIVPEWRHPVLGSTVREMLAALPPEAWSGVRRLERR